MGDGQGTCYVVLFSERQSSPRTFPVDGLQVSRDIEHPNVKTTDS